MKTTNYNYLDKKGLKVAIIAGENGSGKSRYLKQVAEHFAGNKPVTIVCNSVFDRFVGVRKIQKISVAQGKNFVVKVLKKTLIEAANQKNPISYNSLAKVLNYCGYLEGIGIELTNFSLKGYRSVTDLPEYQKLPVETQRYIFRPLDIDGLFDKVAWFNLGGSDSLNFLTYDFLPLLKYERLLKKAGAIGEIKLYFRKRYPNDQNLIPVTEGSSGELTLIATRLFLQTAVKNNSILIIDEPENSLHPLWQKEYINSLLDILYYQQPKIVIATHSPIIVSANQVQEDSGFQADIEIYQLKNDELLRVSDTDTRAQSVEDTYWNVFNTITPVNHFVSEKLVEELHRLNDGETSFDQVINLIQEMKQVSYDPKQKEFFEAAEKLTTQIHNNEVNIKIDPDQAS